MACGCPIVSSDVGAIPEMLNINNDACGICFKPHSSENIFKAISSLIDNYNLKKEYSSKSINRVNDKYTISKIWDQILDIWN